MRFSGCRWQGHTVRYGYRRLAPLATPSVFHAACARRQYVGALLVDLKQFHLPPICVAQEGTRYQVIASCPSTKNKTTTRKQPFPFPTSSSCSQLFVAVFRQVYGCPRRCGRSSGHRDRRDWVRDGRGLHGGVPPGGLGAVTG